MKKVLISIHPRWCAEIFNGQKTIEVRKSFPRQLETPFEVLVYCTKGKENEKMCFDRYSPYIGNGKVIGSFVCDRIDEIEPDLEYYSDGYDIDDDRLAETCLTREQLREYGKGVTLYGWHITEPKLFDKPKELSEFCVPCKKYNHSELHCMEWDCEHYSFSLAQTETRKKSVCAKEESRFVARGAMWRNYSKSRQLAIYRGFIDSIVAIIFIKKLLTF